MTSHTARPCCRSPCDRCAASKPPASVSRRPRGGMRLRIGRNKTAVWMACASLSMGACAIPPHPQSAESEELQQQYQHAIAEAAVRHSDWNIPLWSFGDASVVLVSTFTDDPALDTVTQFNWVAPTAQVGPLCRGKANPILFLEELLGLPPQLTPNPGKRWHMYTFEVSRDAIFRPCPGGTDESVPNQPRCNAGTALDPKLDRETARFLLQQFWYSHRTPIPAGGALEFGFPWTGMGWTYNWDPQSGNHIGVSEFVVQMGASASNVSDDSTAQFCRAGGRQLRPVEPASLDSHSNPAPVGPSR
jgi:hypothetical protein